MKNIFYSIVVLLSTYTTTLVNANYKNLITPDDPKKSIIKVNGEGTGVLGGIASYITDTLFGVLTVVGIGVFLVLGARLVMARGNPEEFKKNLMWMVYGLIGIAIMTVAYAVVSFVTRISI